MYIYIYIYSIYTGWWFQVSTHLKNMLVKLDHETPGIGVKIPKMFEATTAGMCVGSIIIGLLLHHWWRLLLRWLRGLPRLRSHAGKEGPIYWVYWAVPRPPRMSVANEGLYWFLTKNLPTVIIRKKVDCYWAGGQPYLYYRYIFGKTAK